MKHTGLLFLGLALMPSLAAANVVINEIMYDLKDGGDAGREWIEIYNNGGEAADLANWKLYEAETNHKINLFRETETFLLPAGGYAVIADDPNKFLTDWPDFSGIIFDSAFSLSNTGETIILRNPELADIDNAVYSSEMGANGDGNSLQKINGEWKAASPTPGEANTGANSQFQESQQEPIQSSPGGSNSSIYIPPEKLPKIKAYAGENRTVVVGANTEFRGQAFGLNNESLDNARYLWIFGDGFTKEGKNITHFYRYPGEYIAVLNVSSGEYSASDQLLIKAIPNQVFISELKIGERTWIELENKSKEEIDISEMQIKNGNQIFILPKSSRIRPNAFLIIPVSDGGFIIYPGKGSVELSYPGGFKADAFTYDGFPSGTETFNRDGEKIFIGQETPGAKNQINAPIIKKSETVENKKSIIAESIKVPEVGPSHEEDKLEEAKNINQDASVVAAIGETKPKNNISVYLIAVIGLILFSCAAVFLFH